MSDINTTTLCGRLVRDPEVRRNGNVWATCTVASNRRYKSGESVQEEVAYVSCVLFGKPAEWIAEHKRGEQIIVTGRLRTASWEKNGEKQSRLELVVDQVQFLSRSTNSGFATGGAKREDEPMPDEVKKAVPF